MVGLSINLTYLRFDFEEKILHILESLTKKPNLALTCLSPCFVKELKQDWWGTLSLSLVGTTFP